MVERDAPAWLPDHTLRSTAMIAEVKGPGCSGAFADGRRTSWRERITLVRMSHLAMHLEGHLAELDIKPLMVLPSGPGVKVVGALVVFRGP
jgi:hypothetical protein